MKKKQSEIIENTKDMETDNKETISRSHGKHSDLPDGQIEDTDKTGSASETAEDKPMDKPSLLKIPATRIMLLVIADVLFVAVATLLALYVRYDFKFMDIPTVFYDNAFLLMIFNVPFTIFVFWIWHLYKSVWRYASANEFLNIIFATIICIAGLQIVMWFVKLPLPRSFPFFYGAFLFVLSCSMRFSYRMMRAVNVKRRSILTGRKGGNCMVIGAGASGNAIIKEIESSSYIDLRVCCAIDDNPGCHGKFLRGVPIVGGRETIVENVDKYDISEIILAMPSAKKKDLKAILEICKDTGCKMRILPGMYQIINGDVGISKLREVQIEDLLGRDPIKVNIDEIIDYVSNKTVMVTGGGGSIGSELCRQIAKHTPKHLIIVDIYENSTYEIQQELLSKYPRVKLTVLIASVRNTHRMEEIFEDYKPNIVYHAAAHKHVPLMEDSPNEAIKNNVFGTYKTAVAAAKSGVQKFVLISTDKAVNPTNVMGASKRICEMIIQMMNNRSKTDFIAVRFGNVLGSNGSVVPLFKKQIEQGGPVTVTHPDVIRYFMTIPEAVSLVLQAGAYARGGEIFVLDMGEPMKILDLATNLIKLSGYRVNEDIRIEFTGLRPGEKMYEEMLMDTEGLTKTANEMIYIGKPIAFNEIQFETQLEELRKAALEDSPDIRKKVAEIVTTYHYHGE